MRYPAPLTPFYGRKTELAAITSLLSDPACRLLTLIGPGGIGKTRLAIESAKAVEADFADGVCFVDLQVLPAGDLLPVTIMDALGLAHGQEDSLAHLTGYLSNRQILLVLDNFEHLLPWAELLTRLLVDAPNLKVLVTSRESLNLQEEWRFQVAGIDVPIPKPAGEDDYAEARATGAVQMFAACARRSRADFSLEKEIKAVVEICRLVGGMPLAIELAASWTRMLPCEIIAREIKENIRFLASGLRNIPERHRSLQAVFEQTWRMLSPEEQRVYKTLSVFRGGFTHEAARQVAQASLTVMLGLADKSLLRRTAGTEPGSATERFGLHQVLRQFAQGLLAENEEALIQAHDRHCDYYLNFIKTREKDLLGGRQQDAVREIRAELKNIRAAWIWAVQNEYVEQLKDVVLPLDAFFQFQSRYLEATTLYEQAAAALEKFSSSESGRYTLAQLQDCLGWFYTRLGKLDQAFTAFETSQQLFESIDTPPPPALGSDPKTGLAILAVLRGDYDEAVKLGEDLLQLSEKRGDPHVLVSAHYALASVSLAQGQYERAQQHAQHTCDIAEGLRDDWLLAYSVKQLGDSLYGLRDTDQARRHYLRCYHLRESFNDPEGMALALNHLGKVALLEKNYPEARRCFQESYAIYTTIYDRGGLATALAGLGSTSLGTGQLNDARQYLALALESAHKIHFVPLIISIFVPIAILFDQAGKRERALLLLRFARSSPAGDQETRRLAEEYLSSDPTWEAEERSAPPIPFNLPALAALAEALLVELQALSENIIEVAHARLAVGFPQSGRQAAAFPPEKDARFAQEAQPALKQLVESLTEREIEILRCMNSGLSNKSIADQLVLSLGTVKWYTSQIYGKLQVGSRTQAIARAREMGVL